MSTADALPSAVRAPRLVLLLAFLGFFLTIGAWSVAAPYSGSPDEVDHAVRAAGVVSGQIAPEPTAAKRGSGAFQTVPAGLVPRNLGCWIHKASINVSCAQGPSANRTLVQQATGAGRYQPLYYAAVGGPLRLWPGQPGLILARLISAALSAAMLTAAFAAIWRWSRFRLLAAGVLIGFTPVTAQLSGSINPNGLEIVAAIALSTAGLPLLARYRGRADDAGEPESSGLDRRLLALFGVSAIVLTSMRSSGPVWLMVALAVLLMPYRARMWRALWRDRAARAWSVAIVAVVLANVVWIVAMKATDLGDYQSTTILSRQQISWRVADSWRGWIDEAVAVLAFMDARLPSWAYAIWESIAAAVLIWALVGVRGLDRWRLIVAMSLAVLVPSALQYLGANSTGFITQGRYLLALLVGAVLVAADTLERRILTATQARSLVRLCLLTLLPIQLFALLVTMQRYQSGQVATPKWTMLNPSLGQWHPVLGSWLPVIMEIVGLIIVAVVVSRSTRIVTTDVSADEPQTIAAVPARA